MEHLENCVPLIWGFLVRNHCQGGGTFSPKVNFDNVLPILERVKVDSLFWFPGIASKLWCYFPTADFVNPQCMQQWYQRAVFWYTICETFSLAIDLCSNYESNFVYMIHRSSPLVTAVCMGDFGIPEGGGGGALPQ